MTNDMFIQLKIILRQFYGDVNHFYFYFFKALALLREMWGKIEKCPCTTVGGSPPPGAFRRSNLSFILCISLQIRMQIQHLLLRDPLVFSIIPAITRSTSRFSWCR